MSPEQDKGESLDARSDIFSFAVVLYEMITGHQPFAAESAAMTISAIVSREPAPLARYTRQSPETLEWIVTKALRKDRNERYQSAKEIQIDLGSLKHKLEFEAEPERTKSPEEASAATISLSGRQATVAPAKQSTTQAEEAVTRPEAAGMGLPH